MVLTLQCMSTQVKSLMGAMLEHVPMKLSRGEKLK
jgi:hypothetical protein